MDEFSPENTVEKIILNRASSWQRPVTGTLELLPLCNMNCGMCYVRRTLAEVKAGGGLHSASEWMALGKELQADGVLFLLLTGGEPLLFPGFQEVYSGLRELGMLLTVNTNGTLIDEGWADFFAENRPRRINITLYGKDGAAYRDLCGYAQGYERTVGAVRLLRERGVDVKVGVSAARANASDIEKIIALGETFGVPVRTDTYMMPAKRERDESFDLQSRLDPEEAARIRVTALKWEMGSELFPQYVAQSLERVGRFVPSDEPRGMTCYAGNCSFTVNWQGNLRPCVVLGEPSVNAFDRGFLTAWQEVRTKCQKIRLNLKCSQCNLRPVCRTCPACALLETGSYQGIPDYMCRYAAESYRLLKLEMGMQLGAASLASDAPASAEGGAEARS